MNFVDSDKASVASYTSSLVNNMNRLDIGSNAPGSSFNMNCNEFPSLSNRPGSMGRGRRPRNNSQKSSTTA
ncbi:unnamed protein product [Callosobruchus maculatus]|uniref:Uncharacterized protein n=1 Tax=Callosobruchus maculatus TaxID=64391 RepID=A0A653CZ89_CALMS|nr:unnamed protein product [Callosobruchus maculatus]